MDLQEWNENIMKCVCFTALLVMAGCAQQNSGEFGEQGVDEAFNKQMQSEQDKIVTDSAEDFQKWRPSRF